jgi:hypothetical protein
MMGAQMPRSRRAAIGLIAVFLSGALNSGCSYLFMETAPPRNARRELTRIDCTSGKAAPVTDTVLAVLTGLSAASAFLLYGTISDVGSDETIFAPVSELMLVSGLVYSGLSVLAAFSAAYGYRCSEECERAETELALRLKQTDTVERKKAYLKLRWEMLRLKQEQKDVGCQFDSQCKGNRICENSRCVFPSLKARDDPAETESTSGPKVAPSPEKEAIPGQD